MPLQSAREAAEDGGSQRLRQAEEAFAAERAVMLGEAEAAADAAAAREMVVEELKELEGQLRRDLEQSRWVTPCTRLRVRGILSGKTRVGREGKRGGERM